jgi:hypothetical protein
MGPQSHGPPKSRAPKVTGILVVGVPRLPNASLETKCTWMWASWRGTENTIKGEGMGFPQVHAVMSLMSLRLPVANLNTKSAQIMH